MLIIYNSKSSCLLANHRIFVQLSYICSIILHKNRNPASKKEAGFLCRLPNQAVWISFVKSFVNSSVMSIGSQEMNCPYMYKKLSFICSRSLARPNMIGMQ